MVVSNHSIEGLKDAQTWVMNEPISCEPGRQAHYTVHQELLGPTLYEKRNMAKIIFVSDLKLIVAEPMLQQCTEAEARRV